jgi:hypothetical protein
MASPTEIINVELMEVSEDFTEDRVLIFGEDLQEQGRGLR